jgi:hypothetical protein
MKIERLLAGQKRRLRRNWNRATLETFLAFVAWMSRRRGVRENAGGEEIIISLTTTAERLPRVHCAVESLLRQTLKPHRIVLWITDKLTETDLTTPLLRQQRRGLEIRFRRDLRSFTKLLYTLREHPSAVVATGDDDTLYPREWLRQLHDSYLARRTWVHCQHTRWISSSANGRLKPYREWEPETPGQTGPAMRLLPLGVGGVLYPPGSLHSEIFNENVFLQICPTADDIWFKAMSLLNGVQCCKSAPMFAGYPTIRSARQDGLSRSNLPHGVYDRQIRDVFNRYGLLQHLEGF